MQRRIEPAKSEAARAPFYGSPFVKARLAGPSVRPAFRAGFTRMAIALGVLGVTACSSTTDSAPIAAGGGTPPTSSSTTESEPPADAVGPTAEEEATFRALIPKVEKELAKTKTPGASVAIVLRGKLAFASGVGTRKVGGEAVTTSTRFRAGSMSKMLIAATAMTLVEQGALDLHAPIKKYLPWFTLRDGFDATSITLESLLTHTSGFPGDTIGLCEQQTSGAARTFFEQNPQPLWSPPGAAWTYSNAGYSLAALVVAAAAGKADRDIDELVHDRILAPLGMNTTFDPITATKEDHAIGYVLDSAGHLLATNEPRDMECPMLHAPGGANATATDYAHFAEMLLAKGQGVIAPESVAEMEAPHADTHDVPGRAYGYGLFSQTYPYAGHTVIEHPGAIPGFASQMTLVPDLGFGVVVLVNSFGNGAPYLDIAQLALDAFVTAEKATTTTATPASSWAAYAGTYDDAFGYYGKDVTVTVTSGAKPTLVFDAPNALNDLGRPAPVHGEMTQFATDSWILPDRTQATFFPNQKGVPTYLSTRIGTGTRRAP